MRVQIKRLMEGEEVLAGTAMGNLLLARLLETVGEPTGPETLFLDFAGVSVATASFLRDGPLAFRQVLRSKGSKYSPVFANVGEKIMEELRLFLESRSDAVFCCTLSRNGAPSGARVVGRLDEKQSVTLELVKNLREVDASMLAAGGYDARVKPTAWNNRLSALAEKGLVLESIRGRTKRFRLSV